MSATIVPFPSQAPDARAMLERLSRILAGMARVVDHPDDRWRRQIIDGIGTVELALYDVVQKLRDITPVIQPFELGTEDVRITDMTGRHLAAVVDHYRLDHPWGAFLHATYPKFLAAGGRPGDRVAVAPHRARFSARRGVIAMSEDHSAVPSRRGFEWTRFEETAIKERCLKHGWDSLFFITLDNGANVPKWAFEQIRPKRAE
jgi:hypothetical protein